MVLFRRKLLLTSLSRRFQVITPRVQVVCWTSVINNSTNAAFTHTHPHTVWSLHQLSSVALSPAGHASLGSDGHNWRHPAKPTQICLQLQTGSSQQSHSGKHDAALMQHKRSGNAFVQGFTSPSLPLDLKRASQPSLVVSLPPTPPPPPPPPAPGPTHTKGAVEYSQFWFGLCRQRRSIFPRGWRQLAWGRRRRVCCHLGGAHLIRHRVRLW